MSARKCPTALEYGINFTCPHNPETPCGACPTFHPNHPSIETFIPIPTERGKTDYKALSYSQNRTLGAAETLRTYYEETNNKAFAIKCFNLCYKSGIYPPMWALGAIYNSFDEYLTSDSKLINCFGNARGKDIKRSMNDYIKRKTVQYRINNAYAEGIPLMTTGIGDTAVDLISEEDDASAETYGHYAKEKLTDMQKLQRSYIRSRKLKK